MQKKVRDVFNNEIFSIPNYQRDYAWKRENLEDLWEDLLEAERARSDTMGHFLGTIVVSKNPQSKIYEIIDGQQRATTLFMLRYALNFKTENPQRNLNHFLDDEDQPRLQLTEGNRKFFEKILEEAKKGVWNPVLENEAQTEGQRKMCEVLKAILDYTSKLSKESAKTLLNTLDNMVLMWLEEQNSGRAIRVFQSVNDRGVPLLILDKLKALLILYSNKYCDGVLDEVINQRFGEIFRNAATIAKHPASSSIADKDFTKATETRLFNYHALGQKDIGHYSYGAKEAYNKLKNKLKNISEGDPQELKTWLDDYSRDLQEFVRAFLEIIKETECNIEAFKLFYILKINPFFYASLVRLKMKNILDDELLKFFAKAEILFYGLGSTNDASAYRLYETTKSKEEFKNELIALTKPKTFGKGNHGSFDAFIEVITRNNEAWKKYFHYLFLSFHAEGIDMNVLKGLIGEKTYNAELEHIIPQNASHNGSLEKYGFKDQDDFDSCKGEFGNLLVLESKLNSGAKDKDLAGKQEYYKKSYIPYNREFANREDFLNFDKKCIKQENEKFKQWAREFFKEFLQNL